MVNVTENYKLVEVLINGKLETVKINTSDAWNVFEFISDEKTFKVEENDQVQFTVDGGSAKVGTIVKLSGKGEKTKIKIVPLDQECEEIWSVMSIQEGSFKVIKKEA
jgi:hypothetical protein